MLWWNINVFLCICIILKNLKTKCHVDYTYINQQMVLFFILLLFFFLYFFWFKHISSFNRNLCTCTLDQPGYCKCSFDVTWLEAIPFSYIYVPGAYWMVKQRCITIALEAVLMSGFFTIMDHHICQLQLDHLNAQVKRCKRAKPIPVKTEVHISDTSSSYNTWTYSNAIRSLTILRWFTICFVRFDTLIY